MRHEFEFNPRDGELVIRLTGAASAAGFDAYMETLRDDPRMATILKVFVDLSGLSSIDLDLQDAARLGARQQGRTGGATRVALVVGGALSFGIARQFTAFSDVDGGPLRRVFHDPDEAWAWLRQSQGSE